MGCDTVSARIKNQPVRSLDVILPRADGSIILGGSNLTGRTWNGALMHVTPFTADDDSSLLDLSLCSDAVETDSGVCDAALLTNEIVVAGHDSGCVTVWSIPDTGAMTYVGSLQSHHDLVVSVSAASDGSRVVSGSSDRSILISDAQRGELLAVWTGHVDAVTSVAYHPTHADLLVSAGRDGRVVLWDQRLQSKPATLLEKRPVSNVVTSIAWGDGDKLAFGTSTGNVELRSTNDPAVDGAPTSVPRMCVTVHKRAVTNLCFALPSFSKNSREFAVLASASDDCSVVVTGFASEAQTTQWYANTADHSDFVRGLSWNATGSIPLLSCSWDGTVCCHKVPDKLDP